VKLKCVPVIEHAKCVQRKQYGLGLSLRGVRISAVFLLMTSLIIPEKVLAISVEKGGGTEIIFGKPREEIDLRKNLVDPPSTLSGKKLSILQVMQISYAAGFQSEEQLVAATAIAISESGLWSAARNWHPEQGNRPATDLITVKGPSIAWSNGQQMHSDRGIWQIASFWYPQYSDAVADNPKMAAIFAYELSESGTNFTYWDSYLGQRAQIHFDRPFDGWPAVRPLVKRFLLKAQPLPPALEYETSIKQGSAEPFGAK
jgi:hypothetical protein